MRAGWATSRKHAAPLRILFFDSFLIQILTPVPRVGHVCQAWAVTFWRASKPPRGALGVYDPAEERYTLYADVQYPHRVRNALATNIFKVPEHQIRVIAGDVGGGFGTKGWQYPEHRLVLWAARKLGRPVKWSCDRRDAIPADEHARDNVTEAELGLDADGRFVGLRVRTLANVGAYVSSDRKTR